MIDSTYKYKYKIMQHGTENNGFLRLAISRRERPQPPLRATPGLLYILYIYDRKRKRQQLRPTTNWWTRNKLLVRGARWITLERTRAHAVRWSPACNRINSIKRSAGSHNHHGDPINSVCRRATTTTIEYNGILRHLVGVICAKVDENSVEGATSELLIRCIRSATPANIKERLWYRVDF